MILIQCKKNFLSAVWWPRSSGFLHHTPNKPSLSSPHLITEYSVPVWPAISASTQCVPCSCVTMSPTRWQSWSLASRYPESTNHPASIIIRALGLDHHTSPSFPQHLKKSSSVVAAHDVIPPDPLPLQSQGIASLTTDVRLCFITGDLHQFFPHFYRAFLHSQRS